MELDSTTSPIVLSLIVALVINLSMFLVAFRLKSDKLTDISYAVTFAVIALFGFSQSEGNPYHVLLAIMVLIWAARLGGFLLYRVIKKGKDVRFDGMRENFLRFGRFWFLQALTVWVLMFASIFAFSENSPITSLAVVGLFVWAFGLIFETAADFQKIKFGGNPNNKNKWIEHGLWRYSRHPNYFGEILVWLGVYLYALPSLTLAQAIIGALSPLYIALLLIYASGVPILEKSADRKWGNLKSYRSYKKRTSVLFPLPPKN